MIYKVIGSQKWVNFDTEIKGEKKPEKDKEDVLLENGCNMESGYHDTTEYVLNPFFFSFSIQRFMYLYHQFNITKNIFILLTFIFIPLTVCTMWLTKYIYYTL